MSAELVDRPGPVRRGEELEAARVDAYLRAEGIDLPPGLPEVLQFQGGASNLTYLLRWAGQKEDGAGRDLILRRPPFGHKAKSAHDMKREATILAALAPLYPVPKVLAFCSDPELLGSEFFVMERLHGLILRRDLPHGLNLEPSAARRLALTVIDSLIELHSIPIAPGTPGGEAFAALGRGDGYVRRQVEGWSDRYRRARTDDAAEFATVMVWLGEKQPQRDASTRLLHNDFRFDNVILDLPGGDAPPRVVGVLDWEMATLGDPLADLGNTLAYWVEADDPPELQALRRQPTHLPGMPRRQEVLVYYGERTGLSTAGFDFYLVYGLFRLAGIAQQIYFRYRQGLTEGRPANPAFAAFGPMTHVLERRCLALIEASTL